MVNYILGSANNIDIITVETISLLKDEIDVHDVISMVFLLYDVPHTALERLLLLQRESGKNLNLLDDWAKKAQSRVTWRHEFLEALAITQSYSIIRKIGFNVESVILDFLPNNVHANVYINPMKKVLYKICENMTFDNFLKLKNTLFTYMIDVREHKSCEEVFLKLMCSKFIVINEEGNGQVENLAKILENLPGMDYYAAAMREIAKRMNFVKTEEITKVPSNSPNEERSNQVEVCKKKDTSKILKGAYEIINRNRLGICYIINQEKFYPSQKSIEMKCDTLDDRKGSQQDRAQLQKTMEALKFEVIIHDNLNYEDIFTNLKHIIKHEVLNDDSVFILCILSHGIEGCIYSADSIPVEVRNLEKLLDGDDAHKLTGKPKVILLQACQVAWQPPSKLVADTPTKNKSIKKSDFLILWATVPEYEAYRDEEKGSLFVQILCLKIHELAHEEHLDDIFKKVNNSVVAVCSNFNCTQVCVGISTLRKKLYLKMPH